MQIVSLESENIKGLKAVHIDTNGEPVIVIGGKNDAGKSSVLDSIFYALGGKDALPSKPIRNGEKKARVSLDLGDIIVERTFTEGDSRVKVKSKDGATYQSPQAMLDALCSRLAFDPLEFSRLDAKKQAEQLRKLVGIDFTELDAKRKTVYDERTIVNRQLSAAKAKLASAIKHVDAPAEEVSLAELTDEMERRQQHNEGIDAQQEYVDTLSSQIEDANRRLAEIEQSIASLKAESAKINSAVAKASTDLTKAEIELKAMKPANVDEVREQIRTAGDTNAKVAANRNHARLSEDVQKFEAESESLSAAIAEIDAEKDRVLQSAPFPVPGLGLDDSGVTFGGLPLNQASSSERLRVSTAIGMAQKPKLRVMLIRDASLIDDDKLETITSMAEAKGYQLWLERVSKTSEGCTVFIQDGSIVEQPELVA